MIGNRSLIRTLQTTLRLTLGMALAGTVIVGPANAQTAQAVYQRDGNRYNEFAEYAAYQAYAASPAYGQESQEPRGNQAAEGDREAAARDREQAREDREQDKSQRLEELYDEGRAFLDEGDYGDAAKRFSELVALNGPQTDAALYWRAYAENRQGRREAALATLADLNKRFPQSRWQKDASALSMEVRQSSGQNPNPDTQTDEELKLLAIQSLMNSSPERAIPLLEKQLSGSGTPQEKSKALFVLAQNGDPKAMEVIARVARGQSNPDLQRKAVEYLGIFGGPSSQKLLGEVYASSNDPAIKRSVLKSYMIAGDKDALLGAAKNEKNEELKREAIKQLGLVGGTAELEQLYRSDGSVESRREILQAFFLAGDSERLVQAALNEKDLELRRAAIKNLGLIGNPDASKALGSIYAKESDRSLKEEVLNSYFLEGNSSALVAVARSEKDPGLRRKAVEKLALISDKTSTDYMMELLQK